MVVFDAATREKIGGVARREPGQKEQAEERVVVGGFGDAGAHGAGFDRPRADLGHVDPGALSSVMVKREPVGAPRGREHDGSGERLAEGLAHAGRLDAVGDGVAREREERLDEGLGEAPVDRLVAAARADDDGTRLGSGALRIPRRSRCGKTAAAAGSDASPRPGVELRRPTR